VSRIVCWFSCGAASAVATRLTIAQHPWAQIVIARCRIDEEHEDNDRFAADCERWFGQPIVTLTSEKYGSSIENVFIKRGFMSGPRGAPCTLYLKKEVRRAFQWVNDTHIFGYTADAKDLTRWDAFLDANNIQAEAPLIDRGLQHADCLAMIENAGIALPAMYLLDYQHNNCKGCVKATGPGYWNKVRRDFPLVFQARASLSRRLNCKLVQIGKGEGSRIFLDELPPDVGNYRDEPEVQCGVFCHAAEQEYS